MLISFDLILSCYFIRNPAFGELRAYAPPTGELRLFVRSFWLNRPSSESALGESHSHGRIGRLVNRLQYINYKKYYYYYMRIFKIIKYEMAAADSHQVKKQNKSETHCCWRDKIKIAKRSEVILCCWVANNCQKTVGEEILPSNCFAYKLISSDTVVSCFLSYLYIWY